MKIMILKSSILDFFRYLTRSKNIKTPVNRGFDGAIKFYLFIVQGCPIRH